VVNKWMGLYLFLDYLGQTTPSLYSASKSAASLVSSSLLFPFTSCSWLRHTQCITMHYTTLAFTFLTIAHAYPIPRWTRTVSGEHAQLVRMRQVASPSVISTPTISTPVISSTSTAAPPAASGGPPKYVVAHHMVGNTYPYTLQDWADDIALAHSSGIDGFALNMGNEVWEPARVSDA
jgi:Glycosyl hydrolase family 71